MIQHLACLKIQATTVKNQRVCVIAQNSETLWDAAITQHKFELRLFTASVLSGLLLGFPPAVGKVEDEIAMLSFILDINWKESL